MKQRELNLFKLIRFIFKTYFPKGKFRAWNFAYLLFRFLRDLYPLLFSFLSAKIIDDVITIVSNGQDISDIYTLLLWFGVLLLGNVVIYNGYSLSDSISYLWLSYIEDDIFLKKFAEIEPQAYEDSEFVNKKGILGWNAWVVFNSMITSLESLSIIVTVGIAFVAIAQINIYFALIAVLAAIPGGFVTSKFGKKVWSIWSSNSDEKVKYANYRSPLWETKFELMQELSVFGYGKYLIEKAKEVNYKFTSRLEKNNIKRQIWLSIASIWKNVFFLVVIYLAVRMAINGNITVGSLTFVIATYQNFNDGISDFIYKLSFVTGNRQMLENFYNIMNRENKIKSGDVVLPNMMDGISIEFRDVSFKYPDTDKWIFKDLSFKVDSDEDLALVGKNGAGKTTLIKLLLRVYDPNKGDIYINGVNLKDLNLPSYYKNVGVLNQSFNRLSVTARDNIHVGNIKNRDESLLGRSVELADADGIVSELPKGMDTFLTKDVKGGHQLSGGQWQKIAIARAFYRDAKLLILDEPTSAVDAISEEKIFDNIRANSDNQTTLIVSHRFSTVRKAKKIVVVDKGTIVEDGKHNDLMKNKGLYWEMYTKQSTK